MKWEKFDHTHLYPDGEYVIDDGKTRRVVEAVNDRETDPLTKRGFDTLCWYDHLGREHDPHFFVRIFRLDLADTPTPVEQANAFLDARFDTIN